MRGRERVDRVRPRPHERPEVRGKRGSGKSAIKQAIAEPVPSVQLIQAATGRWRTHRTSGNSQAGRRGGRSGTPGESPPRRRPTGGSARRPCWATTRHAAPFRRHQRGRRGTHRQHRHPLTTAKLRRGVPVRVRATSVATAAVAQCSGRNKNAPAGLIKHSQIISE